jgi:hypothetical protein
VQPASDPVSGFGSPYGKGKTYRPYRGAQLAPALRFGDRPAAQVKLTPTRRGLLEAAAAGKVRDVASVGWKCGRKVVNALVADCVRAGWLDVGRQSGSAIRTITLTPAGRRALGDEEVAP